MLHKLLVITNVRMIAFVQIVIQQTRKCVFKLTEHTPHNTHPDIELTDSRQLILVTMSGKITSVYVKMLTVLTTHSLVSNRVWKTLFYFKLKL